MAKPKAKTLNEFMGFKDADLHRVSHDQIMLWLDANVQSLLETYFEETTEWSDVQVTQAQERFEEWRREAIQHEWAKLRNYEEDMKRYQQAITIVCPLPPNQEAINTRIQSVEQRHMPELPPKPRLVIVEKEWERPVTAAGRPQFIVGFLDFSVKYRRPQICFHTEYESGQPKRDFCYVGEVSGTILFEVKGRIDSLGALLRQLATYRTHLQAREHEGRPEIVVVSPDTRFIATIEEQGYGFIRYEAQQQSHLGDMHPSEVSPYLRRMATEDIATVAAEAYEVVNFVP